MGGAKNVFFFQVCIFMYVCFACVLSSESGFTNMDLLPLGHRRVKVVKCLGFLYVCMYGCLGSLSLGLGLENAQILRWSAISVYPPTRQSKKRPQTVSRSTFSLRFWQGPVLRFSRSIHPSIHPCIRSIFTVVFENTQFLCM